MHRRFLTILLLGAWGSLTAGCGNGGRREAVNPDDPAEPAALCLKSFVGESFKFDYPASWAVSEKDDSFSIAAPEGAVIKLDIVQPEIDASKALAISARHHEKEMTGVTKTEFKQWGKYQGHGLTLQGKYNSVVKSTVRVFAFADSQKTFVITEYVPDDKKQQVASGFRAVENSFQVIR